MNQSLASNPKQNWRQLAHTLELGFYLKIILILVTYYFFSDFVFDTIPLD